ncbi:MULTISPECIES: hypothetical protein [Ramlibacter]|uniref:DUF1508 domain-containing protein n=1 Tax=Ramlibacter pinisoli TaxID=2682844 RepID=A0A6N8IMF6_9BURK|nr:MULTISPECIES: hypothetical protein [Ramlibacter]MBA2960700.1 hypothetical protein [Ramlibacter sp. CGMCC 1.13660]MVQ28029.1 hypothetical protein [Ramlibacter pinisoli]
MTKERKDHRCAKWQVFLMRSKAGHWMFEVRGPDDQVMGGGGGYEDAFEALDAAEDAFPGCDMKWVIQQPMGYMVNTAKREAE